jgi:6-phosphofructokinase 1
VFFSHPVHIFSQGFYDFENYTPVELTPELVANIHHEGGTVLGSSRGGFDLEKILSFLKNKKISCLFVIGGDGTHRGAFSKKTFSPLC